MRIILGLECLVLAEIFIQLLDLGLCVFLMARVGQVEEGLHLLPVLLLHVEVRGCVDLVKAVDDQVFLRNWTIGRWLHGYGS